MSSSGHARLRLRLRLRLGMGGVGSAIVTTPDTVRRPIRRPALISKPLLLHFYQTGSIKLLNMSFRSAWHYEAGTA